MLFLLQDVPVVFVRVLVKNIHNVEKIRKICLLKNVRIKKMCPRSIAVKSYILPITRMLGFFQCLTIALDGFRISNGESSFSRIFTDRGKSKKVQIWSQHL